MFRDILDFMKAAVKRFIDKMFPEDEAARMLKACRHTVAVEQNHTSQLARLIRMCTGLSVDQTINKYDGRPFSPEDIVAELH